MAGRPRQLRRKRTTRRVVSRGGRARIRRRVGRRHRPRETAGARASLRNFRQATILAVALTAMILLFVEPAEPTPVQTPVPASPTFAEPAQLPPADSGIPDTVSLIEDLAVEDLVTQGEVAEDVDAASVRPDTLLQAARDEASRTVRRLWIGFLGNLPKFAVVLGILLVAWLAVKVARPTLRAVLRQWERANALAALAGIVIWLFALGVAASVIAGDPRALVGSLGLVGLALSWALQTPIESFTGWLLNSFQSYYRVGDRVAVGEVFGDVYKIDFLTTTVWEIGSLDRPGFVNAEQPTGRLITFPNSEVLAGSIVNLTRDFPYVWDEITIPIADQSDLGYAAELLREIASAQLREYMELPSAQYEKILQEAGIEGSVAPEPEVFVSIGDSWTNLTVRYLVGARSRRRWKSDLVTATITEFDKPEHKGRIVAVFPRQQIQFIGPDGKARDVGTPEQR